MRGPFLPPCRCVSSRYTGERMRIVKTLAVAFIALSSPLMSQPQFEKGKDLLNAGKTNEALALFREIVQTSPRNAEAWRWLGEAYFRAGKLDSAENAGKKVIAINDEQV